MISIGHNNWLTVNLEKNSCNNISNPFAVEFNTTAKVMKFDDAADYTAQLIAGKFSNLHLCLSGGMDSEYVATVLLRNKIPFTSVIVAADHLESENWYAYKFCKDHNINPTVLDFRGKSNYIKLIKLIIKYAHTHNLPFDRALLVNIVADLLPTADILTGYGDPVHVSSTFDESIGNSVEITDHDYFLETVHGDRHPSGFFSYTPELFLSMAMDIDSDKNTQVAKADLYRILCRAKIRSSFFNFYHITEIESIVHASLDTLGKNLLHQTFLINRDTLFKKLTGL
jgi:hypothetical protein